MSSNESDKTQFRQPKPDGDRTVFRPSPGGRKKTNLEQPPPLHPQADLQRHPPVTNFERVNITVSKGTNPLVAAASTLLAVFEKVKGTINHPDIAGLHRNLANEIKDFETELNRQGYSKEVLLSSRYLICSVLDEAVLNTPWGSESPWGRRTLLSVFHNETSGGEKSFAILDRLRERPADHLDVLELFYLCLSLGFEGKYRLMARGRDELDQLCSELFRIIRNHRGEYERTLSSSWEGVGKVKSTLSDVIPMWVVVTCVVAVICMSYSGFRYWLYQSSSPVVGKLVELSVIEEKLD